MTTYAVDTGALPTRFDLNRIENDEAFVATNGTMQAAGRTGNRWGLVLTWRNAEGTRGRIARAYGALLHGKRHRLRVDVSTTFGYTRAGAGGGSTITVNGAHSAGATSIAMSGTGSVTNWLLKGDLIEINGDLKEVRADVSLAAGAATVEIWPELHEDLSGGEGVDIDTPEGVFYVESSSGFGSGPFPTGWFHESMTLNLIEDILD